MYNSFACITFISPALTNIFVFDFFVTTRKPLQTPVRCIDCGVIFFLRWYIMLVELVDFFPHIAQICIFFCFIPFLRQMGKNDLHISNFFEINNIVIDLIISLRNSLLVLWRAIKIDYIIRNIFDLYVGFDFIFSFFTKIFQNCVETEMFLDNFKMKKNNLNLNIPFQLIYTISTWLQP